MAAMACFQPKYKDRHGELVNSPTWWVEMKDHLERRQRVPGFRDLAATRELERRLKRLVVMRASGAGLDQDMARWVEGLPAKLRNKLGKIGLLERRHVAASQPLSEHLKDFQNALEAKGNTAHHVAQTVARVKRVLDECRFVNWTDIDPQPVERFLFQHREKGDFGAQSSNYYLQAANQFTRWMVRMGRGTEDPLRILKPLNARTDVRRKRRALTSKEARSLLESTSGGPERAEMLGPERAILYRVALETGLRAGELRSLRVQDFTLDTERPAVRVRAAYSKHRREDVLPLRHALSALLCEQFQNRLPSAPAFRLPRTWRPAEMLRADLEAAKIEERDADGRVVDFHALRHTYITNLARGGVQPQVAKQLARHGTISLTLDRYTHVRLEDERNALDALPDLEPKKESEEKVAVAAGDSTHLGSDLGSEDGNHETRRDAGGHNSRNDNENGTPGGTRTPDPRIRNPMLYPAELRARMERTIAIIAALVEQKFHTEAGIVNSVTCVKRDGNRREWPFLDS